MAVEKAGKPLRARAAKRIAARSWRLVIDPNAQAPWRVRRKFKTHLPSYVAAAQDSLGDIVATALDFDAKRFRDHLETDSELTGELESTIDAIAALLRGDSPQLQAVPDTGDIADTGDITDTGDIAEDDQGAAAGDESQDPDVAGPTESPDA